MDLTHELRALHATVRCGSMSGAARQLGLTQPTISAHIAYLERRHGIELFLRQGRKLLLTDLGQSLYEIADRMFEAETEAHSLIHRADGHVTGQLRISAVGPYHVTPMLGRFRTRWPNVRMTVNFGDSADITAQILGFQADVGVVVHEVDDPRIHNVPLGRQQLVVFAPAGHALAAHPVLRLRDLQGQPFVIRERGSTTRRIFEDALRQAGVRVEVALELGSREAVREAVAQGLGLGVVGEAAYGADARLVRLDIADFAACTHPHVICLRARQGARLVRHFLDVVASVTSLADDASP